MVEIGAVDLEAQGAQRFTDEDGDVLACARRDGQEAAHPKLLFQGMEPGAAVRVEALGLLHQEDIGTELLQQLRLQARAAVVIAVTACEQGVVSQYGQRVHGLLRLDGGLLAEGFAAATLRAAAGLLSGMPLAFCSRSNTSLA